jgi:hypothetical protein
VWKHIPLVLLSAVLAAQREGLAWRATRDELYASTVLTEFMSGDVTFNNIPIARMPRPRARVESKGIARVMVPLDDGFVLKARARRRDCEPSCTCEKLD